MGEAMFIPCKGREHCTEEGSHCLGCGRSHEEIRRARDLVEQMTVSALDLGYANTAEFIQYVAAKTIKKVTHRLLERNLAAAATSPDSVRRLG